MNGRCLLGLAVGFALAVVAPVSRAERELSRYEQSVVAEVEAAFGGPRELEPEGKLVEEIVVYRLRVFDRRDPVPDFVNWLHATTRERVIARESLLRAGARYTAALAAETERNLRDIFQLSLVLVVPLPGSRPDRVRVALVTKDIWSLRAAWDPEITSAGFSSSDLSVDEINVAGRLKTASVRGGFDPGSYWYGLRYLDPRVAGSRNFALAAGQLVFDRETGDPEGSFGNFWYGQDLYTLETRWAYSAFVGWRDDRDGSYLGGALRTFDARATTEDDALPLEWDRGVYFGRFELTRSYGRRLKLNIGGGMEALRSEYALPVTTRGDPAALAELERLEMPPSRQRMGPTAAVHTYSTRYLRTLDVDTLALQEDIALGHDVGLRISAGSGDLGSSYDVVSLGAFAGYTQRLGDGFARATVASVSELAARGATDSVAEASVHLVSPRLGFGRLVFSAEVADRFRDYLHQRFLLGGENRLRGYAIGKLRGADLVAGTLEVRTTSVGLWGAELGAAAFYDVGDAPAELASAHLRSSVGAGARVLVPMFDRTIFRVDLGFPLDRGGQDNAAGLFIGFRQAIPTPTARRTLIPTDVIP